MKLQDPIYSNLTNELIPVYQGFFDEITSNTNTDNFKAFLKVYYQLHKNFKPFNLHYNFKEFIDIYDNYYNEKRKKENKYFDYQRFKIDIDYLYDMQNKLPQYGLSYSIFSAILFQYIFYLGTSVSNDEKESWVYKVKNRIKYQDRMLLEPFSLSHFGFALRALDEENLLFSN